MKPHFRHPPRTRARAGYSLMEMLIAIGIFTIGFAGIAAIFPAAAALQRNSAETMLTEIARNNAEAVATSTNKLTFFDDVGVAGLYNGDLGDDNYFKTDGTLQDPNPTGTGGTVQMPDTVKNKWSVDMRSYPTFRPDPLKRDFYWIPLIRSISGNAATPQWQLFVFVLRRQSTGDYRDTGPWPSGWSITDYYSDSETEGGTPGITRVDVTRDSTSSSKYNLTNSDARLRLRPRDWVVSQNTGTIFRVESATSSYITVNGTISLGAGDPDKLWVGVPPANFDKNPVLEVFPITNSSLFVTP